MAFIYPVNPMATLDHNPCIFQSNLPSGLIDALQPNNNANTEDT